jgi:hypothetical protein
MELSTETTADLKTQAKTVSIDLITVASIAVVIALLDSFIHEALSHGLAALLLGLHPRQVSTTFLDVSYLGVPAWKSRIVDAAGCGAQLIAAIIGFVLMGFVQKSKANSGLYLGLRGLDGFSGKVPSGPGSRRRRRAKLIYTSYLTIGMVGTFAAIFNPLSPQLVLISGAAATFGGNAFMLFMLAFGHKPLPTTSEHPMTPTRSWLWLYLGLVALFIEFFVLAPGLPR